MTPAQITRQTGTTLPEALICMIPKKRITTEEQLALIFEDKLGTIAKALGDETVSSDIDEALQRLLTDLRSGNKRTARTAANRIMKVVWPNGAPRNDDEARWWHSPLGYELAKAGAEIGSVTQHRAALMLNVKRGTLQTTLVRGRAGISAANGRGVDGNTVLARLADRGLREK